MFEGSNALIRYIKGLAIQRSCSNGLASDVQCSFHRRNLGALNVVVLTLVALIVLSHLQAGPPLAKKSYLTSFWKLIAANALSVVGKDLVGPI